MKTTILTLAIALAFSFTAVPADAAPTEEDRCKAQVVKADRKYSMCVAGVSARDLRFGQQTVGQATTINDCDSRRTKAYNKIDSKFPGDDFPGCGLDAASKAARAQATLVTAGLAEAAADITSDNAALCTDAGGTYDAGTDTCTVDITSDNAALCTDAGGSYNYNTDTCTVDITSNDQSVCETAGGSWESGTCTAVSSYNCTIGALCSTWAAELPTALPFYTNNYINHTAATSGCAAGPWSAASNALIELRELTRTSVGGVNGPDGCCDAWWWDVCGD